jgi:hypothetical protein
MGLTGGGLYWAIVLPCRWVRYHLNMTHGSDIRHLSLSQTWLGMCMVESCLFLTNPVVLLPFADHPRWVRYYLDHDSLGPTAGVPYDYVVPATALYTWQVNPPMLTATANLTSWVVKPQEQVRAGDRSHMGHLSRDS